MQSAISQEPPESAGSQPEAISSLTQRAYSLIKRAIVKCSFGPASFVTEVELAAKYGVGRAAVRAALSRLHHEGLVRPVARLGYEVAPITIKRVRDLFAVRLLLEPPAAKLAAGHADPEQLRILDELCRAGYESGNGESVERFLRANTEFHVTIARASGNQRLAETLALVLDEMERFFHFALAASDRDNEMRHEHHDLVEALLAGDGASAERIAEQQIRAAQKMVIDVMISGAQFETVNLTLAKRR